MYRLFRLASVLRGSSGPVLAERAPLPRCGARFLYMLLTVSMLRGPRCGNTRCGTAKVVSLECVVQLGAKMPGQDKSDSEWIVEQLQELGYWAHCDSLQATDYGAVGVRERMYWAAAHGLAGNHDDISLFFNKILVAFKCCSPFELVPDFITLSDEARASEAEAARLPMHRECLSAVPVHVRVKFDVRRVHVCERQRDLFCFLSRAVEGG